MVLKRGRVILVVALVVIAIPWLLFVSSVDTRVPVQGALVASRFDERTAMAANNIAPSPPLPIKEEVAAEEKTSVVAAVLTEEPAKSAVAEVAPPLVEQPVADKPGALPPLPGDVHIFYYPWYGNPTTDGKWLHWNHKVLPHWTQDVNRRYPSIGTEYVPPDHVGASFYPELGAYSTLDDATVLQHFTWMRQAGTDVAVVSWWGATGDSQARDDLTNRAVPVMMKAAAATGVRIAFHMEPYEGRSEVTTKSDVKYLIDTYGNNPGLYRCAERNNLPTFYVYDSYHTRADAWARLLTPRGDLSVRDTPYDGVFISLYLQEDSKPLAEMGGFDGIYTYFASVGFTQGSTPQNWVNIAKWAEEKRMLFIPSVGPGYDDVRVRPWNSANTKSREGGVYYDNMFNTAIKTAKHIISVTSFNEWHEGTQIEPSVPRTTKDGYKYEDFSPEQPDFYLTKTAEHVALFHAAKQQATV